MGLAGSNGIVKGNHYILSTSHNSGLKILSEPCCKPRCCHLGCCPPLECRKRRMSVILQGPEIFVMIPEGHQLHWIMIGESACSWSSEIRHLLLFSSYENSRYIFFQRKQFHPHWNLLLSTAIFVTDLRWTYCVATRWSFLQMGAAFFFECHNQPLWASRFSSVAL